MILRPAVNKWIKLRSRFKVEKGEMCLKASESDPEQIISITKVRIIARPFGSNSSYHDYGIYMGSEQSKFWLDGVKRHHFILVGGKLARINGYEFRYIESAEEIE